ncbi:hypothetical protein [Mycolicibacter kumamotonensis]|nr:hypothetical protein [Mycolicibacter kumamotonensis]
MKPSRVVFAALGFGAVIVALALLYGVARWGDCALADLGPDGCLAP